MYSKEIFCLLMTIVYFLISLMFSTNSGYWVFELFNFYAVGLTLVFLMLAQVVMIAWIYGLDNLDEQLQKQTGEKFPCLAKYMIKYFTPAMMFVILVIGFINEFKSNQLDLPMWALGFGRALIFVPISCSLLGIFFKIKGPSIKELTI